MPSKCESCLCWGGVKEGQSHLNVLPYEGLLTLRKGCLGRGVKGGKSTWGLGSAKGQVMPSKYDGHPR
jgi:hypothetical protein